VDLVELPIRVPIFFAEACGYRGESRFVAIRWSERTGELWFSDNGQTARGRAQSVAMLWRQDGGPAALERFRTEEHQLGRLPWLVIDRKSGGLLMGTAADVHRLLLSH
jgi:hypothetical protein